MKNIKNKIKAILFDMDGTIIHTEHVWKEIILQFLNCQGIKNLSDQQREILKNTSGAGLLKTLTVLKEEFNLPYTVDELLHKKIEVSKEYFSKNHIEFIDGFASFHNKLKKANIASSIATNANIKVLDCLNKKINLESFFGKNMYTMEHVGNKAKPDPAVFLHAAKQLNVKPEECVIFEDSLVGFKAAKAAEIKCIAIQNKFNQDILHHADGIISNYHEAEKELEKILS